MTDANAIPSIPLRGDVAIPQLGFGVFQVPPEDTADVVTRALQAGYRHIDTAAGYRNEAGVGQAVHAAGLRRDDVFITTKLRNDDHVRAEDALKHSLAALEMEHVDLYLIHWPVPAHDHYVEVITGIADERERTPAQVVLRRHVQLGHVVIPKSVTPSRIEENLAIFDFELTDDDMAAIETLDRGERTGPDPDTFIRPPA